MERARSIAYDVVYFVVHAGGNKHIQRIVLLPVDELHRLSSWRDGSWPAVEGTVSAVDAANNMRQVVLLLDGMHVDLHLSLCRDMDILPLERQEGINKPNNVWTFNIGD